MSRWQCQEPSQPLLALINSLYHCAVKYEIPSLPASPSLCCFSLSTGVGPASVLVGNLVAGKRIAQASGRDLGQIEDNDLVKKVNLCNQTIVVGSEWGRILPHSCVNAVSSGIRHAEVSFWEYKCWHSQLPLVAAPVPDGGVTVESSSNP